MITIDGTKPRLFIALSIEITNIVEVMKKEFLN